VTDFGDYDPDDAWDATDPVVDQLRTIGRRIAWVIEHRDDLPDRVQRIVDDIEYIRQRVEAGDL
jgi:hypothetical protein